MTQVLTKSPVQRAFTQLCRAIDSPLARRVKTFTHLEMSKVSLTPAEYSCANAFRKDYLLVSYLSKWGGLQTGIDTKEAALSSFAAAELQCANVNRRLKRRNTSIVDPVLHGASRLIANLLGDFSLQKLDGKEGWGPGATYEFTYTQAYTDAKIADVPFSVTPNARALFERAIKSDRAWCFTLLGVVPSGDFSFLPALFNLVPGSRITTVPKNAKTDRTIAIEPRGNMFLQKSVGKYVRSRLKRVGVNLDDQSINQHLAGRAIIDMLATLDLKAASDTVSSELIWMLLPYEWACYLDTIRSRAYTLNGRDFTPFQKLSSMGNGFTFEIESLLFWALTQAVRDLGQSRGDMRVCAVYGDDIICPQEDAHQLASVLNYCGFEINTDKSFFEGNFFESCGRHYFDGHDVTPVYQKEVVTTDDELAHIRFHNRLIRWALRGFRMSEDDGSKFLAIARNAFHEVENRRTIPLLPFGVEGDDGYLVSLSQLARLETKRRKPLVNFCANRGWRCPIARPARRNEIPAIEAALYANKLRINDLRVESNVLTGEAQNEYVGNIECRQETSGPLERGYRWVIPVGGYVALT